MKRSIGLSLGRLSTLICSAILALGACQRGVQLDSSPDGRFGSECGAFCSVTVAQLVITPERYHQKVVQIEAEVSVDFENVSARQGEHRVWLSLNPKQRDHHGKQCIVRGTYDGTSFGHLGLYGGTIEEITRIDCGTTRR